MDEKDTYGVTVPNVDSEDVKNILLDYYGLKTVKIKALNGYDDKNFLIEPDEIYDNNHIDKLCTDGYVLKVINSEDSKEVLFFEAQNEALLQLGKEDICCPKPIKTRNGSYLTNWKSSTNEHLVRLLEFIPGNILLDIECSPLICFECGAYTATLHEALKNFDHEGYHSRDTIWQLKNVPQILNLLSSVKETDRKLLVQEVVKSFSDNVVTKSINFKKGLIHGDINEQNVLVEQRNNKWHVKGIIDFGDSHIGCFIYDLAITMAYIIIQTKDIQNGGYVLAGYTSKRELPLDTIKCLKSCICARICQSLVIGAYTFERNPENRYVLSTANTGWMMLQKLWEQPDQLIIDEWLRICTENKPEIFETA